MEQNNEELAAVARLWDEAMVSNDAFEISRFMTDDWVIIGSDGITSKVDFMQSITSGTLTHHRMDADELLIRIYGETGIVVGRGTSAGRYKGENFSWYEWSTSVFLKKEGTWICALTMLTPANKK